MWFFFEEWSAEGRGSDFVKANFWFWIIFVENNTLTFVRFELGMVCQKLMHFLEQRFKMQKLKSFHIFITTHSLRKSLILCRQKLKIQLLYYFWSCQNVLPKAKKWFKILQKFHRALLKSQTVDLQLHSPRFTPMFEGHKMQDSPF